MARMARRTLFPYGRIAMTLFAFSGSLVLFATEANAITQDSCLAAINKSAQKNNVPAALLMSIAHVESGYSVDGIFQPWPWTVNHNGQGYRFNSRSQARNFISSKVAAGLRNFDVGCFQINYRWHSEAFSSPTELLDPQKNALYAGRFLRGLYEEFGTWEEAVGAYHSRSIALSDLYLERVHRMSAQLDLPVHQPSEVVPKKQKPVAILSPTERAPARLGSLFNPDREQN